MERNKQRALLRQKQNTKNAGTRDIESEIEKRKIKIKPNYHVFVSCSLNERRQIMIMREPAPRTQTKPRSADIVHCM